MPKDFEKIKFSDKAEIAFNSLDKNDQETIAENLYRLKNFPDIKFPKLHKIVGWENTYVIKATPKLRIIFSYENDDLIIEEIASKQSLKWGSN